MSIPFYTSIDNVFADRTRRPTKRPICRREVPFQGGFLLCIYFITFQRLLQPNCAAIDFYFFHFWGLFLGHGNYALWGKAYGGALLPRRYMSFLF
jgi:hypothetical protein